MNMVYTSCLTSCQTTLKNDIGKSNHEVESKIVKPQKTKDLRTSGKVKKTFKFHRIIT